MKQTNNALKYLIAQYRSIYKHAYVKGLAAAALLTVGLGMASTANAYYTYTNNWSGEAANGTVTTPISGSVVGNTNQGTEAGVTISGSLTVNAAINASGSEGNAIGGHYTHATSGGAATNSQLTINANGSIALDAIAGWAQISGEVAAGETLTATGNTATLNGGNVTGMLIGGKAFNAGSGSSGSFIASNNIVDLRDGTVGKNVLGGYALYTGSGNAFSATANSNQVTVASGVTVGGSIIGGKAQGVTSSIANENIVTVNASDSKLDTIIKGAEVWLANNSGATVVMEASKNQLTLNDYTHSGTGSDMRGYSGSVQIIGGHVVSNEAASGTSFTATAAENVVSLNNANIDFNTATATGSLQIVGNMVDDTAAKVTSGTFTVKGDGVNANLTISNSNISRTNIASGSSIIAGGYVTTVSGSAIASGNVAVIDNSTITDNAVYGGYAEAKSGDATATGNVLTLTGNTHLVAKEADLEANAEKPFAAMAAYVTASGSVTADNNVLNLNGGIVDGAVYGVRIAKTGTAGKISSVKGNQVIVNGGTAESVYGVHSALSGSFSENSVTINTDLDGSKIDFDGDNPLTIAAVWAESGANTFKDNTVTIAEGATVTNAKIFDVITNGNSTLSNLSGNAINIYGTVKNSDVFGGSGSYTNSTYAGSTVTIGANGTYTVDLPADSKAKTITRFLGGDKVDVYGTVHVGADAFLNVTGSLISGSAVATGYNKGTTTFYDGSNLDIDADGTVQVISGSTLRVAEGTNYQNDGTISLNSGATFDVDVSVLGGNVSSSYDAEERFTTNTLRVDAADVGKVVAGGGTGTNKLQLSYNYYEDDVVLNQALVDISDVWSKTANTDNGLAIVLNNVAAEAGGSLSLSKSDFGTTSSGQLSGIGSRGITRLQADQITYTVASDNQAESLAGVTLFAKELVFKKTTADANTATLVSGSNTSKTDWFGAQNVTTADGSALTVQNATLWLCDVMDNSQKGEIEVDLTLDAADAIFEEMDFTTQDLTLNNGATMTIKGYDANVTANALTVNSGSVIFGSVDGEQNSLTVQEATFVAGGMEVRPSTAFIVTGDNSGSTVNLTGGNLITINGGSVDLSDVNDTVALTYTPGAEGAAGSWGFATTGYDKLHFGLGGGTVRVDLSQVANISSLTLADANTLLGTLATGTGLLEIYGSAAPNLDAYIHTDDNQVQYISAADIQDAHGNVSLSFTTAQTQASELRNVEGTVVGGWKAVTTAGVGDAVSVGAGGQLSLYGSTINGDLVADSTGATTSLDLGANSKVVINGTGGNVTAITGSTTDDSALTVNNSATINVTAGDVTMANLLAAGTLNVTSGDIEVGNLYTQGATITAQNVSVTRGGDFELVDTTLTAANDVLLDNLDTVYLDNSQLTAVNVDASSTYLALEGQANLNTQTFSADELVVVGDSTVTVSDVLELDGANSMVLVGTEANTLIPLPILSPLQATSLLSA